jgi:hypothetical protein
VIAIQLDEVEIPPFSLLPATSERAVPRGVQT